MTWYYRIKIRKSQVVHFLVFLSGVGILIWQIWNTIKAFIEGQTTFATSQQFYDAFDPPTLIVCEKKRWSGLLQNKVNISDEDWYTKQFLVLNDTLTLTLTRIDSNSNYSPTLSSSNLTLGNNFDERGKTFFVEKLFNHWYGMCYALTPDQNYKLKMGEYFQIKAKVAKKENILPFELYIVHPEYRYGYLLESLGQLGTGMLAESGNLVGFKVKKIIWNYLSSKRNCRNYENTPPNFRVLYTQKPKVAFPVFHFVLLYIFPNECPGLC